MNDVIVQMPVRLQSEDEEPAIERHGMGYRGVWPDLGFVIDFDSVHAYRGDLSGMLTVRFGQRTPFCARMNIAVLSTRTTMAKRLKELSGYTKWETVFDQFARGVIMLHREGPPRETVGDKPPLPALPYRLRPICPENTPASIYGPPEAGKSTIAAVIALSVQTGRVILPDWYPLQGNVMILDWETDASEWNDRMAAVAHGAGISSVKMAYRRCRQPLHELVEPIAAQVSEEDVKLLIIDSMFKAQGSAGEHADAGTTAQKLYEAIDLIGTTALLIDQVTGDNVQNGDKPARPYGSVMKAYETRSMWELRGEAQAGVLGEHEMVLLHRKFNRGAKLKPQGLRTTYEDGGIHIERCVIRAPDLEPLSGTIGDRMAKLLAEEGALGTAEIAERLGLNKDAIRVTMNRDPRFQRLPDNRIGRAQ